MAHVLIYSHPLTGHTIRLLNIEPGENDSPLGCCLHEITLGDAPASYYALSYCWGADSSLVEITCNSQPFFITPNLHSVLLEYRRRGVNTPLWVDAVCIDQTNVTERTSQVRMMQSIYSQAARVVVWLGEATATDGMALEVLKAINAPWATIRDPSTGRNIPLFTGQNEADHDAALAGQVPDTYFDALAAFLLRPWFSRIWIVQELICARELSIWCGEATLDEDFPVLESAARMLMMHNCYTKTQVATTALKDANAQGIGRSKLICPGRLWGFKFLRDSGQSSILTYLLITRSFDATDPRDKIFALVGLADDVDEEFVDYTKSYEDVVRELSRMMLDGRISNVNGSTLDFLACITREEEDDLDGLSWVVDWFRMKETLYTPLVNQFPSEQPIITRKPEIQFLPTKSESLRASHGPLQTCLTTQTLHIRCTIFDTLTHIVPSPVSMRQLVPQSEIITSKHLPSWIAWHHEAMTVASTILTDPEDIYRESGEPLYEAFWRTLCCNRSAEKPTQPPKDDTSYLAWRQLLSLQEARIGVETEYIRICTRRKKISYCVTAALGLGLTYRFRQHKLLRIAIPLSVSWLTRFMGTVWDIALQMLKFNLFKEYMQMSTQVQIDQRDFENSHSQWAQGRQFGLTQQGRMGWVPVAARVGDNFGLFAGCRVPFVLRVVDTGYKLVGDAYVHGVMDGEGEASVGEMLPIV